MGWRQCHQYQCHGFDRKGYVEFDIVPWEANLSAGEIDELITAVLDTYTPNSIETYASFSSGDKVAAVGAVGVLAGMVGVKYSKTAAGGLLAAALILLKKFFFILLLPFIWIGKLFKKKDK